MSPEQEENGKEVQETEGEQRTEHHVWEQGEFLRKTGDGNRSTLDVRDGNRRRSKLGRLINHSIVPLNVFFSLNCKP